MRVGWILALLCLPGLATGAPNVLNATTHADTFIAPAINAVLGAGHVDTDIFVDYYSAGTVANMVAAATNGAASYTSVASGLTVNHAPYGVLNASLCCYATANDQTNYPGLVSGGIAYAQPIGTVTLPIRSAPPTAMITVSSPNSTDGPYTGGGTNGWGLEFGLSASYLGLDTSADSWDSAEITGFVAALQFNHPAWNFFDAKAALRITADRWGTGYDSTHFGFGLVSWSAANTASTLYLQGPGISVRNQVDVAIVTLYPFRQTRRSFEVIYSVPAAYVWPVKNEYTASDLAASGGTLLYTSNGTDVEPSYTFTPAVSGTVTFIAFTTDGSGNYSRVESYSAMSASLLVGTSCHN